MKKQFEQGGVSFFMEVKINSRFPNYHNVMIHGSNGYHEEKRCSTSELDATCANMELDARMNTNTTDRVEYLIIETLQELGFE